MAKRLRFTTKIKILVDNMRGNFERAAKMNFLRDSSPIIFVYADLCGAAHSALYDLGEVIDFCFCHSRPEN